MEDVRAYKEVSSYTVLLSSSLSGFVSSPLEMTCVRLEPHGAVLLCRFVSGEEVQRFELSGAEVDALMVVYRRRLLKRVVEVTLSELDLPF